MDIAVRADVDRDRPAAPPEHELGRVGEAGRAEADPAVAAAAEGRLGSLHPVVARAFGAAGDLVAAGIDRQGRRAGIEDGVVARGLGARGEPLRLRGEAAAALGEAEDHGRRGEAEDDQHHHQLDEREPARSVPLVVRRAAHQPILHLLVTFPRRRIERFARLGEKKMKPRKPVRAILALAGAALAAVLLVLFLHHTGRAPEPQPGNDFDPADFVRGRPRLDAPYVATDLQVVDAMLGLAQVKPDDMVIDLGSGDGRILIAAARSLGAHGLGVDIDPARIRESTANAEEAGVSGRVTFRQEDLFQTPLQDADVLTLYLLPEINLRLRPRILGQMRPGTRVISHDYDMGDWHWDQRQHVANATIYLWVVPARIDGAWRLNLGDRVYPLVLEQHYQQFYGSAGEGRVEQGRLNGDRIRFLANLGEGRRTFEGRVDGDTIVPLDAQAGWRAHRVR